MTVFFFFFQGSWHNFWGKKNVRVNADGARTTLGRQVIVREKARHASWIHCVPHGQGLASSCMNEEFRNLLKNVTRTLNHPIN